MSISVPKEPKTEKGIFKSNIVRLIIFCILILVTVIVCCQIFKFTDAERSNKIMEQFYAQEENTVDCIYFGSSATQRGWVVPEAYHNDGIASYSMACGSQPFVLTRYMMAEALNTQKPKLFIVELRGICKGPDDLWDVSVRRILDNMKMSSNKREAIDAVTDYAAKGKNSIDQTKTSYYFPFLQYHSLWNPSKQPDYGGVDYYKGYALEPTVVFRLREIYPHKFSEDNVQPIAPASEDVLNDLLDYCDTIDSRVLFVVSPYEASLTGMGKINYAQNIIEKRGYEVLNCLPAEVRTEIGLDNRTCYYNREHLNLNGSRLYTAWLSDYIKKNYDVPDRSGDKKYSSWEKEYERLTDNLNGMYSDLYQEMIKNTEAETE